MTGKEIVGLIEKLKPFGLLDTQINDICMQKPTDPKKHNREQEN